MRPTNDMHKLIKKLQIEASAELDGRVHNDISRAIAESEPAVSGPTIWRIIMRGGVMKLAVAAAIVIAFGIGFFVGQRSEPIQLTAYPADIAGYNSAVSVYPAVPKAEESFWQQKIIAAMQPRPYAESQFDKTNLLNAYKQYLKEKHYD